LVVGLGNPGRDYEATRHNAGFMVVERLAGKYEGSFKGKGRFSAEVAEIGGDAGKLVLLKPQTYMNRSGSAVAAMLGWLKVTPAELLVVVDDADLPLGQLRLRLSGGSGGHNGLSSIIDALGGSKEFARLRVGIGRKAAPGQDISGHVLGKFSASERKVLDEAIAEAVAAVECCWKEGLTTAMNQFNRRTPREAEQEGERG
jgi:peptidyl-tRNA hydrolase, PTH1 family